MRKSWHLSERLRNLIKPYSKLGIQETVYAVLRQCTFIKDLICPKNSGESDSREDDPFVQISIIVFDKHVPRPH